MDVIYAGQSEGHPWELKYPRLVNWLGFSFALLVSLGFLGLLWLLAGWGG